MKNPYLHLVGYCWKYAGKYRRSMVVMYLMYSMTNIIRMVEPLLIAQVMNLLQQGGENLFQRVLPWIVSMLVLEIVFWVIHGPARIIERKAAFFIGKHYTEDMFQKVTGLPLKWHRDHHTGESYDKIDKARRALFNFFGSNFQYISTGFQTVISIAAILYFLPWYGALSFVFGLLVILTIRVFDKILIANQTVINKKENEVSSTLFDYISNITTVITLRLEKLTQSEVSQKIQQVFKRFYDNTKVNEWKWFITSMIVRSGLVVLLALYIFHEVSTQGIVMIGGVVALYQYLQRLNDGFFNLAWQWEEIIYHATNVRSAETISSSHDNFERKHRQLQMPKEWKKVEISKLRFRYEDEEHKVHHLRDINITLQKGKTIALVGSSGSGKTTLMKLLRELETPDAVEISIDGTAYDNMSVLNEVTTLFPQDPEIFENSIEYNITAGIKHRKKDIGKAVKMAAFNTVLKRLPSGLSTNIKEKGVNLSGGERQRLALARGIFTAQDSSILLLDEPTSSVDTINERRIYENLFRHFKDRCIVSSIHRLHLLPLFDEIYVMQKGRVVEQGSFQELTKNNQGVLHAMWKEYGLHS